MKTMTMVMLAAMVACGDKNEEDTSAVEEVEQEETTEEDTEEVSETGEEEVEEEDTASGSEESQ